MRAKTGQTSRPNLSDVAKHAGVSPSTVSLVLSGKAKSRYISDEVILRVETSAALLDYSPNMLVRSMQRGRTNIFCFYNCFRYSQSPTDLYTVGLFTAAAQSAGERGCNLLLFCDFSLSPAETYHTLKGGHSDGVIIFAPQPGDPLLAYLRNSRLPAVLLNSEDEMDALSSVKEDVALGMKQLATRLLDLGHRKIAMFTNAKTLDVGDTWNVDAPRRISLLQAHFEEANIFVHPEWIIPVPNDRAKVRLSIEKLMEGPDVPTALFCWDDYLGYLVLEECESLGISVPERLSIVGYDGIQWPSRTSHTLASVHVNLNELAQQAVGVLADLAHANLTGPIKRVLPVTFQDGTTLASPA